MIIKAHESTVQANKLHIKYIQVKDTEAAHNPEVTGSSPVPAIELKFVVNPYFIRIFFRLPQKPAF
ncbi:hypothetical protein FACS1894130_05460 [Spirochaetia bacterium]|nr:hypothetical protein FACS1894130_05460 [Spirochaetia bacterium]